jgi:hypothetical protein
MVMKGHTEALGLNVLVYVQGCSIKWVVGIMHKADIVAAFTKP